MHDLKTQTKNYIINQLMRHRTRNYGGMNTMVISGTPRGGTTWVAESIAQTRGITLLWEPLALHAHPEVMKNLRVGHDHCIEPFAHVTEGSQDWELKMYLRNVIEGNVPAQEYLKNRTYIQNLTDLVFFKRFLIKFIRGNLLLYWLLREFPIKGILLIRHPCAVISSQMDFAWDNAIRWKERWRPFLELHYPHLSGIIDSISTDEEVLALDWALVNIVPLRQPKPHPWMLTHYEHLLESDDEWERICKHLETPPPTNYREPSSSVKWGDNKKTFTVDAWEKKLSRRQIDMILRICYEVGMDCYDDTPYPK